MKSLSVDNKDLILRLPEIAKIYMGTGAVSIKYIGGGSYGKVFKCTLSDNRVLILKAYRVQGMQEKEAGYLRILAKNTSVKMPEVYFTHADDSLAAMGMSFIEGSNVLSPAFLLKSKKERRLFAEKVVAGMLEWHNVSGEKYGDLLNPTHDSWLEYYREKMVEPRLEGLKKLCKEGKYPKKSLDLLLKATELFFKITEEPKTPVITHTDLNIMNIMADKKTFELKGFIDPCGSMWADKEYDLFQFLNMWGGYFKLYDEYKKAAQISEHCDFKVAYYAALNEASCRLNGALVIPVWEIQCNNRLKKAMRKYK